MTRGGLAKCDHMLARYCQSVLRTTTQVNGKVGNLTPAPSKTPEPIVTWSRLGFVVTHIYIKLHLRQFLFSRFAVFARTDTQTYRRHRKQYLIYTA